MPHDGGKVLAPSVLSSDVRRRARLTRNFAWKRARARVIEEGVERVLERTVFIPKPRREVFDFFGRAENLERLTPSDLSFRILTPLPIDMRAGTRIDYRIRISGVPMRWKTLIEVWEPDERFVDLQIAGPYRKWRHEHRFREVARGTEMRDRVEYALPLGPLGAIAHAIYVGRMLERIFDFRGEEIGRIFGR